MIVLGLVKRRVRPKVVLSFKTVCFRLIEQLAASTTRGSNKETHGRKKQAGEILRKARKGTGDAGGDLRRVAALSQPNRLFF
jgi:hypothetical protein